MKMLVRRIPTMFLSILAVLIPEAYAEGAPVVESNRCSNDVRKSICKMANETYSMENGQPTCHMERDEWNTKMAVSTAVSG